MILKGRKPRLPLAAIVLAGGAIVAGVPVPAIAQAPAGADAAVSIQALLENKTRLVKLLLSQSPAMTRIPQSNNAQAKKKLADAQSLFAKAQSEAEAGRQAAAIRMLDEALREIAAASRMVPDAAQLASQERLRYAGMSESTRTFLNLYKGLSAKLAGKGGAALDVNVVNGMIGKAETLAAAGNHKDANAMLGDAYKAVVGALNRMLMAETIVYDQKFDTPADEFRYELARNRNYEELVPLAISQFNPPRESAAISESYVKQSKSLRDASEKQAASGDYQTALKTIQDATLHLQRSLRVAGVIVPQTTESKP